MRLLALCLAVLLGATAFAPAPLPRRDRETSDAVSLARMEGVWEMVSMWRYGRDGQVASHVTAWKSVTVREGRWNYCREANGGGPSSTWPLTVGPERPARLDFHWSDKRVAMAGVVRFRGHVLEILYQTSPVEKSRPLDFDQPPEGFYLVRLKKVN